MAKRNPYKNNIDEILQARKDKKELAALTAKMAKRLNQRFRTLEKQTKSGTKDTAYRYAQKELESDRPRYSESASYLEKMNANSLYRLANRINQKLMSETSTISGLRNVYDNRVSSSIEKLESIINVNSDKKVKIDKDLFTKFLENGGGEILNSRYTNSDQIVEDFTRSVQSGNVSVDEFIREYNAEMGRERPDYGNFISNLQRITDERDE